MHKILFSKLKEALISVLPITAIVLIISFTPLVNLTTAETVAFAVCAVVLILGIGLFNLGADLAMMPMGNHVGVGLTKSKKVLVLVAVCFFMGVLITIAEPDLTVLANQVKDIMPGSGDVSKWLLIITVGLGVGLFLVIAVIKIIFHKNLAPLLMFFYMLLFAVCALLIESGKGGLFPLAFDSGGVTTGPITVPFIMALGFGISTTIGGKNASENSFGLIALCSVGPIIAVMLLSLTTTGSLDTYDFEQYSMELSEVGKLFGKKIGDVALALGLIVAFFAVLQFTVLKLPKRKLLQMAVGIVYTFVGLVIFLVAVEVGFMPIGYKIGREIAAFSKPLLVVFGLVIGMVVVLAEPAIHVLNKQVEEVTGGGVKKIEMLIALSIAVGISIGLSLIRMIFKFSLLYYLIPGYMISLGLSFFVPRMYTGIAFDSGGVASGPLTSSFILPLVIGACAVCNGENGGSDIYSYAYGVVAMVAMTPLITIQTLGFKAVLSAKVRSNIRMKRILTADDEQIIYFD